MPQQVLVERSHLGGSRHGLNEQIQVLGLEPSGNQLVKLAQRFYDLIVMVGRKQVVQGRR